MVETVQRRLVITADTSGLAKGATEVANFGRAATSTADALAAAKKNLSTEEYKRLAAALAPAIKAEADMARQAREVEKAFKSQTAEAAKAVAAHQRETAAAERRVVAERRRSEQLRMTFDVGYRNARKYGEVEDRVNRAIEARNLTLEEGNRILSGAAQRFQQTGRQVAAANQNIAGSMSRVEGAAGGVVAATGRMDVAMGKAGGAALALRGHLTTLLGAYAGFAGIRALGNLADEWSDLQSRVANATGSLEAGRATLDRLADMSARTYSSLTQTAEGWLSQKLALDELGISTAAQLDLTETLNNAMVISATRGERAQSVMKAFSDAMATGALRTDGLNTILAGSPRLGEALAASLNTTTNGLRAMATAGTLTADKLVGVSSQLEATRVEADAMDATISDGMVRIQNSMLRFVGAADQAGGSTSALAAELIKVSDWMDQNGHVAVAIGDDIALSISTIREFASDVNWAYEQTAKGLSDLHDGVNSFLGSMGLAKGEADAFGSAWFAGMANVRSAFADMALDVVARISAIPSAGKAAYDVFIEGWRQFPAAMGALIVEGAAKTLETIEGMVDGAIGILNKIPYVEIDARVGGTASGALREQFGNEGGAAAKQFLDNFVTEFEANQARVRDGFTGLASGIGDALGYQTREAAMAQEAYEAITGAAGDAWTTVQEFFAGTASESPAVRQAIAENITEPTKEAERALRDAESARKALFSEADAAVKRFFPFETAVAEAQRLMTIIDDSTNGLNDMQRAALMMQANEGFTSLSDKADLTKDAVRSVSDEFEIMGRAGRGAFESIFDAVTSGGNVFENIMKGLSNVGAPLSNDINSLFGKEDA